MPDRGAVVKRSARVQRTRDAVVGGLLDLIRRGNLRPTAREIADHAGVSLRSVYVHFDDLEDLMCAAVLRHGEQVRDLARPIDPGAPLGERIAALVDQRAELFEHSAPVRRAARLQEPFSPTLARSARTARRQGRAQVEQVFARELGGADADGRLADAVDVALGAAVWDGLRENRRLSVEDAKDTVSLLLRSLLSGAS